MKIKNAVVLMGLLTLIIAIVFLRCADDNGFFGGPVGIPGFFTGSILDANGDPIDGGTIWIPQGSLPLGLSAEFLFFVDGDGNTCPDPTSPPAENLDGDPSADCINDGLFEFPCPEDENGNLITGNLAVRLLGPLGDDLGEGQDLFVTCGTVVNLQTNDVPEGPTPTPTPTPP